ncbi:MULTISPECIES: MarR family winged helix-turn-helix transcriptional regulator [Bacillus]|uniref:MarR family transcriptional regulator n=1 Tax=Bacillus glycinifermentans TaxID=1664069 RepID=A0AAJ3YZJ3_9BACI|nr:MULTISPECIES: MarR family transcriptional regulator [Bacillus]MDU0073935.1 MarR family transcriptional regulator [Bacillus sp. IG6]MED8021839.1 MarR family transcriptional regulator [Bacillus glycinifermentans]QAT66139.1 MarR family transcriptional regulator [Bacillus glycinifermentans]WKB75848.1 MarR family transcriptional regulator [Bacillus glycinifermentans]SCA86862.1 transcriptional regulator, MarR family [Bacillus glycinifermentans]
MFSKQDDLKSSWLCLTHFYDTVSKELERTLKEKHQLALREFYVLLFLSEAPDKALPLQELQHKIGLSQSAMSRLAARMESKSCGVIRRHGWGDDKRGVYTTMTDSGEQLLNEVMKTFEETIRKTLQNCEIGPSFNTLVRTSNKKS